MRKTKANGKKKTSAIVTVIEKLQRSLSLRKQSCDFDEDAKNVPDDVKEGHFAVIAGDDYEFKRFVVPLSYLAHPRFLSLLEQAAEEYGFDRSEGALMIPCRPSELERILKEAMSSSRKESGWSASHARTMVESC